MLALYRAAHNWTVRDVAPRIGISIATLSRIERGHAMDADTMLRLWQWLITAPSCSWWAETRSREEFYARAAAERERLSASTFVRIRDMEKL
jgi:transcriptional regulator with XRE-family HTH domain